MNSTHLLYSAKNALVAAILIVALAIFSFLTFEPSVGRSANPHDFTVTQEITGEISFVVEANDVTMVGSISGITGGYATGTTRAVVRTNNPTGYYMTLAFSSTTAMSASSSAYINNYTPAATTAPDFLWADNLSGQAAEFGYTVRASTTSEVDQSFMNNGSLCNTGSSEDDDRCWQNPTTTTNPERIIYSTTPSVASTSTIKFKVAVPNSPSPALPAAFYVATGTLTATNNP